MKASSLVFSLVLGIAASTLTNSLPENLVTLEKPQTFFRYYSDENSKKGRFLTTDEYATNVEAIRNLALDQKWNPPNQATKVVSVTLPAGTTVYQGIVAPQNPPYCYHGGGQQTFIKDSRDANIQWGEGRGLTLTSLWCR